MRPHGTSWWVTSALMGPQGPICRLASRTVPIVLIEHRPRVRKDFLVPNLSMYCSTVERRDRAVPCRCRDLRNACQEVRRWRRCARFARYWRVKYRSNLEKIARDWGDHREHSSASTCLSATWSTTCSQRKINHERVSCPAFVETLLIDII